LRHTQHIAVYVRTTGKEQRQEPDLVAWLKEHGGELPARWYRDEGIGARERPGWAAFEAELAAGRVARLVVWRLDRLGHTVPGLAKLFENLTRRGVGLVSVRDGLDLETPIGSMVAKVLASVAAFEKEVRKDRQADGIAAAKAAGVKWGGRKPGARYKVLPELRAAILREAAAGTPKATIARLLGLSRPTVYSVLAEAEGETEAED